MPTTIKISSHRSELWDPERRFVLASSPKTLLDLTTRDDGERHADPKFLNREIIQSSFDYLAADNACFASKNGFVHGCIEAYNKHHHLVIRPEDVWLAILTQFSLYVNANAQDMRHLFVEHEGQMDLFIEVDLSNVHHGEMAVKMGEFIQNQVKDPGMRDWIIPNFSTTTENDVAVSSVVFMGTMQQYFTYSWGTRCGLPTATLLGDVEDWKMIKERIKKLTAYGKEPKRWYAKLKPIIEGFVDSFLVPESQAVHRFWRSICDEHVPNGSGSPTYSGWITALCFWDKDGKCLHPRWGSTKLGLADVPMGFTKVPVKLLDNGRPIKTEMLAGSVATQVTKQSMEGKLDTVQPVSGWFIYTV
ncbi:hypothetical protein BJX63DRAFT_257592 [Aspergillus granulosus]|uniref:Uncharacterized protein n=1 Tax=Aspergillus granulosus TaxID=176169 RepID=A0ABR4I068_9EURO